MPSLDKSHLILVLFRLVSQPSKKKETTLRKDGSLLGPTGIGMYAYFNSINWAQHFLH